jgi:hypothetical protein
VTCGRRPPCRAIEPRLSAARQRPGRGHRPVTRPSAQPLTTRRTAVAVLTGLRPSPTSHAVVGFRFSGRLTQGPAVRATDRRHPLRLDMLTSTRSAYVQVRCAVVALWSGHHRRYAQRIRPASTKLDSFLPTSSDIAWLGPNLLSATGGCWNDKASLNGGELSAKLGPATPVRAPGVVTSPPPWFGHSPLIV